MRADWVDKNPERHQGAADGGAWKRRCGATSMENKRGDGRDRRQAPVVQRAGRRHHRPPARAISTTATAASSRTSPHIMKFWADHASYPFKSHDTWFLDREHPLGQVRRHGYRHQGAGRQGQPRGSLARGGQGARRRRGRHPGVDIARRRDLLRRQGLRSGESGRLSRQPRDQGVGLTPRPPAASPAGSTFPRRSIDVACRRPKTDAAVAGQSGREVAGARRSAARRRARSGAIGRDVAATSCRRWSSWRCCSASGRSPARIPAHRCRRPSQVWSATAWDLIVDPFFDNGGSDIGPGLARARLACSAWRSASRSRRSSASRSAR